MFAQSVLDASRLCLRVVACAAAALGFSRLFCVCYFFPYFARRSLVVPMRGQCVPGCIPAMSGQQTLERFLSLLPARHGSFQCVDNASQQYVDFLSLLSTFLCRSWISMPPSNAWTANLRGLSESATNTSVMDLSNAWTMHGDFVCILGVLARDRTIHPETEHLKKLAPSAEVTEGCCVSTVYRSDCHSNLFAHLAREHEQIRLANQWHAL